MAPPENFSGMERRFDALFILLEEQQRQFGLLQSDVRNIFQEVSTLKAESHMVREQLGEIRTKVDEQHDVMTAFVSDMSSLKQRLQLLETRSLEALVRTVQSVGLSGEPEAMSRKKYAGLAAIGMILIGFAVKLATLVGVLLKDTLIKFVIKLAESMK